MHQPCSWYVVSNDWLVPMISDWAILKSKSETWLIACSGRQKICFLEVISLAIFRHFWSSNQFVVNQVRAGSKIQSCIYMSTCDASSSILPLCTQMHTHLCAYTHLPSHTHTHLCAYTHLPVTHTHTHTHTSSCTVLQFSFHTQTQNPIDRTLNAMP